MNNQVNKYFFSYCMAAWLVILLCLIAVIWLNQSLRILDIVITKGASFSDFLRFSVLAAPLWLIVIAPLSAFIAVLWTFHRFLSDRELIVMHAVGLSPLQLAKAPIFFSIIVSALLFVNSIYFLPFGFSAYKNIYILYFSFLTIILVMYFG